MSTQTMSRILLTVLICPLLAVAIYWLFSGAPIFGLIMLVGVAVVLWWVWKVHEPVNKPT